MLNPFCLFAWVGAFCDLVPAGDGCWLVGVPPATGRRHGTDGDPTEPGPGHCSCSRPVPCSAMYLSVRPCCSKVCSHGLAVLQYPGSAHSGLFDDDIPIRHHTLWDHEFVFGPLLTPCFCHLSLGGGPSSCGRRGCEVCYQWQPCALLHLAYSRRGVCGSPTL